MREERGLPGKEAAVMPIKITGEYLNIAGREKGHREKNNIRNIAEIKTNRIRLPLAANRV